MIFRFDYNILDKAPEAFQYLSEGYFQQFVSYILHSDYRKSTELTGWLRVQLRQAEQDEEVQRVLTQIPTVQDSDAQALAVLRWVKQNIAYKGDETVWKMPEYWQTYSETLSTRSGDCEDGAVLIYILCRLKGIEANRMLLFAGSVYGGGHAWIGYRPSHYPLNWSFLDWCYWPNLHDMDHRELFYINKQEITGAEHTKGVFVGGYENYQTIWFGVNEERSYRTLKYNNDR